MYIETKLDNSNCAPQRANPTDAGADLVATESFIVQAGVTRMFDTGVALKIPSGMVGLVVPRSSHGKVHIRLANTVGVIDSSYRGNIKVMITNAGTQPYTVNAYDTRIAQLLIVPIVLGVFKETTEPNNWLDTDRGLGGFGSTGV